MSRIRTVALCLDHARDQQLVALRLASPKRAPSGRDQADAGHLPLFVASNEPRLL